MTYLEWNNELAKHFFNRNKFGTRMWFSVEQELIKKIAKDNNSTFDDFITAVKKGPDGIHRDQQRICIKAYNIFKKWCKESNVSFQTNHTTTKTNHTTAKTNHTTTKTNHTTTKTNHTTTKTNPSITKTTDIKYPPYIAYLSLFVLAVNHGDSNDFSENNYYGRLREILGEAPVTGQYPSFHKMWELWVDLEKWSSEDTKGNFGEFNFDIYGKNHHVGILYYQVVLKTEDQKNLSKIFRKMGWDSDSNPTEAEILSALKIHKTLFSNRTSKRIETGNTDFLSRLTDRVLEELKNYTEDTEPTDNESQKTEKRGSIEICLDIDESAEIANFYYRCKRKAGLPEESFILKSNNSKYEVTPSTATLSQKIDKLNIEDWSTDLSTTIPGKYNFSYKGEKYKIFSPADNQGVSGWISNQRPARDKLFYLAVHKNLSAKVQKWGETNCDQCQKLDFAGLPKNWHLFKITGVNGDSRIKQDIPALAIDTNLRINFEGGIRPHKGNNFFNFAPPKIFITGDLTPRSKLVYSIDNQQTKPLLSSQTESNIFLLPKKTPCKENIVIKIIEQSEETTIKRNVENKSKSQESEDFIKRKKLMLCENRLKKFSHYSNSQAMDGFGNLKQIQSSQPTGESTFSQDPHNNPDESANAKNLYVKGAYCYGFKSKANYPKLPNIPLDEVKKVYLIGNIPGQIIVWPEEFWPESWSPVWLVLFKTHKQAKASLIGDIKEQEQIVDDQQFSKEQIKLWKKILWHDRKRIKFKSKKQQELWLERIKNV